MKDRDAEKHVGWENYWKRPSRDEVSRSGVDGAMKQEKSDHMVPIAQYHDDIDIGCLYMFPLGVWWRNRVLW